MPHTTLFMNHLDNLTAFKLKDLGYPQPEKAIGQFWYDRNGSLWVVGKNLGELCVRHLNGLAWDWIHDTNGFVFAPDMDHIMLQFYGKMEILQFKEALLIKLERSVSKNVEGGAILDMLANEWINQNKNAV